MKQYKVVALSVGAKSNKIFKSEDIVTEDAFHEGHADELVKQGFLVPYEAPKKKSAAPGLPGASGEEGTATKAKDPKAKK